MFTNLLPLFQKLYGNTADAATVFAQFIKDPSNKLIKFINDDLGSYYSKMITKIGNDLIQLSEASSWKERFGDFVLEYNPESFKKLFSFGVFTTISTVIDTIYENLITTLTGKFLNISK